MHRAPRTRESARCIHCIFTSIVLQSFQPTDFAAFLMHVAQNRLLAWPLLHYERRNHQGNHHQRHRSPRQYRYSQQARSASVIAGLRLVSRAITQLTSWRGTTYRTLVNQAKKTKLTRGRITRNSGNQRSSACSHRLTSVSKSPLWLTQLAYIIIVEI